MLNTIKFSVGVVDNKNKPLTNLPVVCKSLNDGLKMESVQSYTNKTDLQGNVRFEFLTKLDSIEVELEVNDYDINYAFQDGEGVTVKLLRVNF